MSITTIWNVLNNNVVNADIKRGIEIPMIQRDYAQGRNTTATKEIREIFLNNLLDGIEDVVSKNTNPLELDFIYGYLESGTFVPLDGQQRLTTLYLIHWYYAFKEQRLAEFKLPFSKFTYQTRQSSGEFLKKLSSEMTSEDHDALFNKGESFKTIITDKNWYFVNWKYDLTIQSCITMLDEIHRVFNQSDILFDDLTNEEKPPIVFNFLDIRDFGLSDDLYIKMNSRGKPLTKFENLKAELGRFIKLSAFNEKYDYELKHSGGSKKVDVETYFVTKIDTVWSDYFWNIRNVENNDFDDKLLNLLAFVSLNEVAKVNVDKFDFIIKEFDSVDSELSYYKFLTLKMLTEDSIIKYIDILDLLVNDDIIIRNYFNDNSLLDKKSIINQAFENDFKANYNERILFYAIFQFLLKNRDSLNEQEFIRWDRLVRNLVVNTIYNRPQDFHESIVAIDKIISNYSGDIYSTILNEEIKGFEPQQIKEEKLKIKLLLKSDRWEDFIQRAESHPYLNGQIIALLSFSGIYDNYLSDNQIDWTDDEDLEYYNGILFLYKKFDKLFDKNGLIDFDKEIFRRALLVKGDYLLYSTNWSLLINGLHRDISWKRLLKETGNRNSEYFIKRCNYLKELIGEIDLDNIDDSLKNIISNSECTDWRKDFIENPILIKKAKQYYLKIYEDDGIVNIYPLRKSKYNKDLDPEIKSILLQKKLIHEGVSEKDIELSFIESLNQFGISMIKNKKVKIAYNSSFDETYIIKQHSKEDVISKSENVIINYVLENFKN